MKFRSTPTARFAGETLFEQAMARARDWLERGRLENDYAYLSRVTPASQPAFQNVFHPVEPFQVRVGLTARF
jgi:hypothetical protein